MIGKPFRTLASHSGFPLLVTLLLPSHVLSYEMAAYCGYDWLTPCSIVPSTWKRFNGAFGPDIQETPPIVPSEFSPSMNYLTLGGYKGMFKKEGMCAAPLDAVCGSLFCSLLGLCSVVLRITVYGTVPDADKVVEMMKHANCDNVDYDMEGVLEGQYGLVDTLTNNVRSLQPNAKFSITCLSGDYGQMEGIQSNFDDIGIMIHADSMQSGGWDIPQNNPEGGNTWMYIQNWINSSVDNSKIVLSITTTGLQVRVLGRFLSFSLVSFLPSRLPSVRIVLSPFLL